VIRFGYLQVTGIDNPSDVTSNGAIYPRLMTEDAVVYAHAPVVEAVIDLQVQLGNRAEECLAHLSEKLADRFPQKDQLHMVAMEMRPDGTTMQRDAVGWRLTNAGGGRILQLKRQGFTYSHMSPYTRWSVFSAEARSLWAEFVSSCSPEFVSRIALRYINRLKLPKGHVKLEDYLAVHPSVPPVYEPVQGLLLQLQGRHKAIDPLCTSVVTIASEQPTDPSFQPVILDIDIFVEKRLPVDGDESWSILEQLRVKKNELFEAAITTKLRETLQ
jgi:uncharacterized protein (TIGR04255 family)